MTNNSRDRHTGKANLFRRMRLIAAISSPLILVACSATRRLPAVPPTTVARARPPVDNVRFVLGLDFDKFADEYLLSLQREMTYLASMEHKGPLPATSFLAISGGGGNGAFGAGLITGWTGSGRPVFKTVTGISTGALIAPFAFLGPKYDPILRQTYTTTTDAGIFHNRWIVKAMMSDAMADTLPLQGMVNRLVTPEFLAEIAAEYAKGRLLLVGTTDLDAQRGVIWNMTAIAASNDPDAIGLFRKILLASASIPGAFPPVMIDVTVGGKRYQEMHVDGGATAQVFIYPPRFHLKEIAAANGYDRKRTLYIIRNDRLDAEWANVNRRTLSIATKAISSLIHTQGNGDLHRMYLTAERDHLDYSLAYIPADFNAVSRSQFDPVYMTQLFARGQEMAAKGYPWQKYPPGYAPDPVAK
jgi:predicted acylesterase/phospholipase RssA